MPYNIEPVKLGVQIVSARTSKGLEHRINRLLMTVTNVESVVDIKYERHYNPMIQSAVGTAMIVFRMV